MFIIVVRSEQDFRIAKTESHHAIVSEGKGSEKSRWEDMDARNFQT